MVRSGVQELRRTIDLPKTILRTILDQLPQIKKEIGLTTRR